MARRRVPAPPPLTLRNRSSLINTQPASEVDDIPLMPETTNQRLYWDLYRTFVKPAVAGDAVAALFRLSRDSLALQLAALSSNGDVPIANLAAAAGFPMVVRLSLAALTLLASQDVVTTTYPTATINKLTDWFATSATEAHQISSAFSEGVLSTRGNLVVAGPGRDELLASSKLVEMMTGTPPRPCSAVVLRATNTGTAEEYLDARELDRMTLVLRALARSGSREPKTLVAYSDGDVTNLVSALSAAGGSSTLAVLCGSSLTDEHWRDAASACLRDALRHRADLLVTSAHFVPELALFELTRLSRDLNVSLWLGTEPGRSLGNTGGPRFQVQEPSEEGRLQLWCKLAAANGLRIHSHVLEHLQAKQISAAVIAKIITLAKHLNHNELSNNFVDYGSDLFQGAPT